VGAANLSERCHSDNRLKVDLNGDSKNITWYNRTVVTHDKFTLGLLGAYGITNHVLVKNNILLGYRLDANSSAYLRLLNNGYRKTGFNWGDLSGYFDHIKLDFVSTYRDWKYGLEVAFEIFRRLLIPKENYSTKLW
jgi:hypothetical protein